MRIHAAISAAIVPFIASMSCQTSSATPERANVVLDTRPCLILLVPGIADRPGEFRWTTLGLRDAGLDDDFEILRWGAASLNPLRNLSDLPANRRRASQMAARIAELDASGAYRRISLIAASGGAGLALLAVERLPAGVVLDRLVLIAPAVSRGFDLSGALAHCRHGAVNFYSARDLVVSLGTVAFGTMDRAHEISAGFSGFDLSDPAQASAVRQIAWEPSWAEWGHGGGHFGYRSRGWASEVLAPVLRENAKR